MPSRLWTTFTLGCISDAGSPGPAQKVRFGVPLEKAFRGDVIPPLLVELLVYISREGVTVRDIFRRSGNNSDVKRLMRRLSEGKPTNFTEYSFYTLASVVKKFLLGIPGGIFGVDAEDKLLLILKLTNHFERFEYVNKIISNLPKPVQQFIVLLFGIWFRIVNHSEFHGMSPEAMAKSVTGCIFRNSAGNPNTVKSAAKVMEILIDEFAMPSMFGSDNLQYFADTTCSGILVQEQFTIEYSLPQPLSSYPCPAIGASRNGTCANDANVTARDSGDCCSSSSPGMQRLPMCAAIIPSHVSERTNLPALCSSAPDVNLQCPQGFAGQHHPNGGGSSSSPRPGHYLRATPGTPPARSVNNHYLSKSLTRFDSVRSRQMARLQKRSHWFLTSDAADASSRCPSTQEGMVSRGAQSLTCWPAADDDAARRDAAAGCSGDCGATVVSSDDALSVFTDLDDGNGCNEGACLGTVSVESVMAVDGICSAAPQGGFDTATTRHYVRETFYRPKAAAKAS